MAGAVALSDGVEGGDDGGDGGDDGEVGGGFGDGKDRWGFEGGGFCCC